MDPEGRLKQEKSKIMDKIVISKGKRQPGGQSCGIEHLPTILSHEDLGIEISINHFRQDYKNKEYGKLIFSLIIDDLIR